MLNWFAKTKATPGLVAVGVDAETVKFAHVDRSRGDRPRACRWAAVTHGGKEEGSSLQRVAKEHDFARTSCTTLLGPADYQILQVDAPNVPPDELKAAIRWRIKDLLNYHVDDATVDVIDLPAHPEAGNKARAMYAVAAPNEAVQKRISLFEHAGMPLRVIDIPEMAQRNLASLFEHPGRAVALLFLGEWGGLLTLSFQGELVSARRLEVTWSQLQQQDYRGHYFERIGAELRRSFDHFERQYRNLPLTEILLAPLPEDVGLEPDLAEALNMPVRTLSLPEVMDFPGDAPPSAHEQWQFFHLFGAALRVEEKAL